MNDRHNARRRALLKHAALGLAIAPLALARSPAALGAELPLISERDAAAKAVHYVEDARRANVGR
jgi:hypothetical protein